MRGRPKKIIVTPEKLADNQYHQIAHSYAKLENAIQELKNVVAEVQVEYEHFMPNQTQEDKVFQCDNKMIFDNMNWTVNDLNRTLSNFLERMLKHADDLKWSEQRKEMK